ncbi:MAG: hypothetical protein JXA96_06210 [Sedimentisphaerales bacterium]|nr:hypothetical protein [Sedimentisphaerales bacterium]
MKRMLFIFVFCTVFSLSTKTAMSSETISFADTIQGVDSIVGWSSNNNEVDLSTSSLSLLGGNATLSTSLGDLTHRLTRGLGVAGGENDEVDRVNGIEHIYITFDAIDYYVNSIEVRSLFDQDVTGSPNAEWGAIDFWLNGSVVDTVYLQGNNSVLGDAFWTGPSILVDKLDFYIPASVTDINFNPALSEFAVAKVNVTAIPVPGALFLGLFGLVSLKRLKLRKIT